MATQRQSFETARTMAKAIFILIANAHRVILIRPKGWTPQSGKAAVLKAREKVGVPYDFLGALGSPSKERFYCSELAAWSMGLTVDQWGANRVFLPGEMHRLGVTLFDSGDRPQ